MPATALDRAAPVRDANRDAVTLPAQAGDFAARINSLRASKGLSQLQISSDLASVASRWTSRMVGAGQISHNPNLAGEVGGAWTKLGENVGVGYDVDSLMQAFINSPSHYQNLVEPGWNYLGVGVQVAGDGRIFTTHNFMQLAPGSAAPSPASTTASTTAATPIESAPATAD